MSEANYGAFGGALSVDIDLDVRLKLTVFAEFCTRIRIECPDIAQAAGEDNDALLKLYLERELTLQFNDLMDEVACDLQSDPMARSANRQHLFVKVRRSQKKGSRARRANAARNWNYARGDYPR